MPLLLAPAVDVALGDGLNVDVRRLGPPLARVVANAVLDAYLADSAGVRGTHLRSQLPDLAVALSLSLKRLLDALPEAMQVLAPVHPVLPQADGRTVEAVAGTGCSLAGGADSHQAFK